MEYHFESYKMHEAVKHSNHLIETWKNEDTVDFWRHERMLETTLPVLKSYPSGSWLTIGDGRYGTDAHFLLNHSKRVLATDINISLLSKAKEEGFIDAYQKENAEKLSFDSDTFDFILCKESYHHFPRPMMALYEMIRVCKKGVILVEPNDDGIVNPYQHNINHFHLLEILVKQSIKKFIGKKIPRLLPRYEPSGNYVYSISVRELEKVALGLSLYAFAYKAMNDDYIEGVEHEKLTDNGPLFRELKKRIEIKNKKGNYGMLCAIIFKDAPSEKCILELKKNNFTYCLLEQNPYLVPRATKT